MAEPSPELRAVIQRWIAALQQRDIEAVENLFSSSDALRYIGSDALEWWQGQDVRDIYRTHIEEIPAFEYEVTDLEAYQEATVGWAAWRGENTFADGRTVPFRITAVFALEAGVWRILQTHISVGVPNMDVIGVELTTSLKDLLESLGPDTDDKLRQTVREGTVTLLFTDIEESTEQSEELGDQAWADVVRWHDETISRVAQSCGGSVVKSLGDGAMLSFESARSAVGCAMGIQREFSNPGNRPQLRLRIGVHTGDAVQTDVDYLGHTVNKAARIAAAAAGGEIMVSKVVQDLVSGSPDLEFGDPVSVELKGLTGTHQIVPLIWN